jgi:hypothetical protein
MLLNDRFLSKLTKQARRSYSSKGDLPKTPPGITTLLGNIQQTVSKNG